MKRKKQRTEKVIKASQVKSPAKKQIAPRTAAEFTAMPTAVQDKLTRVAHAVSKMKAEGVSLAKASKEYHLSLKTVLRWGRSGLRRAPNGRYVAKRSDRLLRVMGILTPEGRQEIALKDSRQATLAAEHWNAAERYLVRGETAPIMKFRNKWIVDATGKQHALLTDLAELDRLGSAGVLSFESIYARVA